MKVQVLFIKGCPNHEPTVRLIKEVIAEYDLRADVEEVEVKSSAEAKRQRFLGSPTVLVDGIDIEPSTSGRTDWGFCCRTFGGSGMPSRELLAKALTAGSEEPADEECCTRSVVVGVAKPAKNDERPALWASAGSVASAVAASACCWLPLLLIASGVSAGQGLAALEKARPLLLVVAAALLGSGFYLIYFRKEACAARSACAASSPMLRRFNRILVWIATLVVVALGLFPNYVGLLRGSARLDGVPFIGWSAGQAAGCCAPSVTDQARLPGDDKPDSVAARGDGKHAGKAVEANGPEHGGPIVFKVSGLTCPAVQGLGCGHKIEPVLARLNKVLGVANSSVNQTGTMLRIAVATSANRSKVAEAVRQVLTKDNRRPLLLTGDELRRALMIEEWGSPGDLSAVEFRTFALHRVQTFSESEKLNKRVSETLTKIAEQQWDRIAKESGCCTEGTNRPADWVRRYKQFAAAVSEQVKQLLTAEQAVRLRQVLSKRFEEKDMPAATEGKRKLGANPRRDLP
jgi:hypothetical protein